VKQYLAGGGRKILPAQVIEQAVENGWLQLSDDGLRVLPGDVYPSLEDAAMRYSPASDDSVLAT
jgi:hypothetical protein